MEPLAMARQKSKLNGSSKLRFQLYMVRSVSPFRPIGNDQKTCLKSVCLRGVHQQ